MVARLFLELVLRWRGYNGEKVIVFRVVLANPLTSKEILHDILAEQCQLAQESENFLPQLLSAAS